MNLVKIFLDGFLLSVLASALLIAALYVNPRMFLHDYPKDIQAKAPPKTSSERRMALLFGIPFLFLLVFVPLWSTWGVREHTGFIALFANAFGVGFIFNLFDWLVLDWLMFCTITPSFLVIPGTEGMAGYKDYLFHFRGFLVGTVLSAAGGLVIATTVCIAR